MGERNPSFLQKIYKLGSDPEKNPEVGRIAERTKVKTGAKVAERPEERIQNYLDYLRDSLDPQDLHRREEKLAKFKQSLYDKNVIKPDEVPEAYFNTQRRLAREQGHGGLKLVYLPR